MRWLLLLLMFFFFGAFFIISNDNLHIRDSGELAKFQHNYYLWLGGIFDNAKSITGYVVKFGWLPDETQGTKNITLVGRNK
jgi:hypothetical protein